MSPQQIPELDTPSPAVVHTNVHENVDYQQQAMPRASLESNESVVPVVEKPQDATGPVLPPTDVGIMPWLQVLGGFLLMFNSWGLVVSYGTFQTYYTTESGITDESAPSTIAWIGSLQAFLLLVGGALTGKLFDAGHFRPMVLVGTGLIFFGLMMVSLASKYYQFMLAQAITMGGGMALLTVTSMGIPTTWFVARRGLAVGIVSSGVSIGGIVYPIMLRELIGRIGFAWAVRSVAFVVLGTQAVAFAVLRQRLPPRKKGAMIEFRALLEPEFALFSAGFGLSFLGFFTFYNYVEEWAKSTQLDTEGLELFYILPVVNAASTFGRILPGFLSDKVGARNVQAPATAIAGILVLVWLPVHSIGPLMTIAILYGFFSGSIIALGPTVTASLTPDMSKFGGRIAVNLISIGTASLIGSPISGAIVQSQNGNYDGARIWSGVIMLVGSLFVLASRLVSTGPKLFVKV